MYEEMKKASQAERAIREEQDPTFKQAFDKLNIDRLFQEFSARPLRSNPDELGEDLMQMQHEKKMSRRDKARSAFVREFRKKQEIKANLHNTLTMEREKWLDIQEQLKYQSAKPLKDMKYMELVDVLNKDLEALE